MKRRIIEFLSILFLLLSTAQSLLAEKDVKTLYFEAKQLLKEGKTLEARDAWATLLDSHSGQLTAKQKQALKGQIRRANRLMGLAPDAKPAPYIDRAVDIIEKANAFIDVGNDQDAKKCFKQALKLLKLSAGKNEKDKRRPYLTACCFVETGEYEKAADFIDEAMETDRSDPRPYNLKARLCKKRFLTNDYIDLLMDSLRLDPNQADINYELAKALLDRGREQDIEPAFEYAKKGVAGNDKLAEEMARRFPYQEMRDALEDLATKARIARAKKELREIQASDEKSRRFRGVITGRGALGTVTHRSVHVIRRSGG